MLSVSNTRSLISTAQDIVDWGESLGLQSVDPISVSA